MDFNDLLRAQSIVPDSVALALHKVSGIAGRRTLCALAAEDEVAFDAHQSTHPSIPQATLSARAYMASFVPGADSEMQFVGLYEISGFHVATREELEVDKGFLRMLALLENLTHEEALRATARFVGRLRFSFSRVSALDELRGRLSVRDPGARNYMRRAETTRLAVAQITRRAGIALPMPAWDEVALTGTELAALPRDWRLQLAAWRGIYLITDQEDGARYVGAAYGEDNMLGRWRTHVSRSGGVTKELSKRSTAGFRFTILELVTPTASAEDVIARERNWMDRLDTIRHGLNA